MLVADTGGPTRDWSEASRVERGSQEQEQRQAEHGARRGQSSAAARLHRRRLLTWGERRAGVRGGVRADGPQKR